MAGLVTFLPLVLTIKLLIVTFKFADGFLGKYLEPFFAKEFGFYIQGISILFCVVLVFIIGFLVTHFLGRNFVPFFERFLLQLPFFKQVYPAFKEISMFLFAEEKFNFRKVVLVEYPRKGIYSVGFLTNDASPNISKAVGADLVYVFVPTTPSPLTGYVTIVPRADLIFPDVSVEEAIKIIVTAGVIKSKPEELNP